MSAPAQSGLAHPSGHPLRVKAWPPTETQPWPADPDALQVGSDIDLEESSLKAVRRYAAGKNWVWPDRRICFLCDVHADADALFRSLTASGAVDKWGPGDLDFSLTGLGDETTFIIGGDCLDKGPENLRLLRVVKHLLDLSPNAKLLAGNHDLRTLLGLAYAGRQEIRLQHLFARMGRKTMRLLEEVYAQYVAPERKPSFLPDAEVRERLFPSEHWYREFPDAARAWVTPLKLEKELRRIREKVADIEEYCRARNWSLGHLYSAVSRCQELFLNPEGEFHWFFARMELSFRSGSFLFVHAGMDDEAARVLAGTGVAGLNAEFRRLLPEGLFELYHGPIGNCFRTKYRDFDFPLSDAGLADLHTAGVYAVVHGHRNIRHGQRVIIRNNLLNFECDASIDCNTRALEKIEGLGAAVTIFEPGGKLRGISADCPREKLFELRRVLEDSKVHKQALLETKELEQTQMAKKKKTEEPAAVDAVEPVAEVPAAVETAPAPTPDPLQILSAESEATVSNNDDNKGKFKFDSELEGAEVATYLEALADGIRRGRLQLKQGDRALTLSPTTGPVCIELKAARKKDKQKIELELSWTVPPEVELSVE